MIRRLLALKYICKKYNLKYDWFHYGITGNQGGIMWRKGETNYSSIAVPLFSKNFWPILFHEVGHLVVRRTLKMQQKHCRASGLEEYDWTHKNFKMLLVEEAKASQFAIRMLGQDKGGFLEQCWYSYTAWIKDILNTGEWDTKYHMEYVDTVSSHANIFGGNNVNLQTGQSARSLFKRRSASYSPTVQLP